MQQVALHYGRGELVLAIPDEYAVTAFAPRPADEPVTYERFRAEFIGRGGLAAIRGEPVVVVNDGFRRTPTALVLEWLDRIDSGLLDRASFLAATGTHGTPSEEDWGKIFGRFRERVRARTAVHDCRDAGSMTRLGEDPLGGEVYVNRAVLGTRPVVVIGSVEPHYFAGYTGGRKGIFPGMVDLATTERNHNLARAMAAAPLRLAGNPVAEHLQALMDRIDGARFFSIQAVLDAAQRVAGVFCGGMTESFQRATVLADQIYAFRGAGPFGTVLAELRPPLDRNLYQLQKAVENCQAAVADGGALVVVSACAEGMGSPHFADLATRWDPGGNAPRDGGPASFGSHKLSRVVAIARRIAVRVHTEMKDDEVRRVFYEPLDNVANFLYLRRDACENNNLAVVYDAGHTVLTA